MRCRSKQRCSGGWQQLLSAQNPSPKRTGGEGLSQDKLEPGQLWHLPSCGTWRAPDWKGRLDSDPLGKPTGHLVWGILQCFRDRRASGFAAAVVEGQRVVGFHQLRCGLQVAGARAEADWSAQARGRCAGKMEVLSSDV